MIPKTISLSQLKIGATAHIESLEDELKYKTRFTEMGIVPGKEILLMQRYSKKGPVCIKVMGSFVMIRKKNADKILVSKVSK
tara:strand:- start:529 stop:774 length:246 start_codon:yes stop_codon:yes gene_type:complete